MARQVETTPRSRYPAHRQQLRDARAHHQHREAACGPIPPLTGEELAAIRTPANQP